MLDRLRRPLHDLRISVTDRCNLRCRYCMPREVYGPGHRFLAREQLLSFEETARLAECFVALGVRKIRLTGGEPLLRRDLDRLVAQLAAIPGVEDLALTTNGLLLGAQAQALARAGLSRVTVSLDALDDGVLRQIADTPVSSARILAGIEAARAAGLEPVKVNMVVRRGLNEDCALAMAEHFRGSGATLRLIEYMDVGSTNGWQAGQVVPGKELLHRLHARWPLEALPPQQAGEVASRYRYRDGAGEIGLIQSVSSPFCGSCTRARLSAEGQLYTCLFASEGVDLRALLRGGASDEEIEARLRAVWGSREDRYSALRSERSRPETPERRIEMSYIGG